MAEMMTLTDKDFITTTRNMFNVQKENEHKLKRNRNY